MNCIFISVRMDSTRLPSKAILKVYDTPSIELLIDNLKKSKKADNIILCTTNEPNDDILCQIAKRKNIHFFRGSTEDKLLRWKGACEKFKVKFFVNVDGDDLFFDHGLADLVFEQQSKEPVDFIDGRGLYNDVYGISLSGINKVCENKKNSDTEFIKVYFDKINHIIKTSKLKNIPAKYIKKNIRMTLDYDDDLQFFTEVVKHFKQKKEEMSFENILRFLNDNPSVVQINWHREENWKNNQDKMIEKITKTGV